MKKFYLILLPCLLYILFRVFQGSPLPNIPFFNCSGESCQQSSDSINITGRHRNWMFYRHAMSTRNSSYPYITGDTIRAFADYIYDETRKDKLGSIKYGDIVFVKTDFLKTFFGSVLHCSQCRSNKNPFVLVTHNSDYSAPLEFHPHLSNPRILAWYAINPSVKNHSKFFPLPIGLANRYWPEGNLAQWTNARQNYRKPWVNRTTFLYVNFAVGNNKIQREKALAQAKTVEDVKINNKRISFDTYLQEIGNTRFVLSPPGNGLDCHRTWESILMGAVPIVIRSELDPLFSRTRTIVLDDWSNLTSKYLSSFNFSSDDYSLPDILSAQYWWETLMKYRLRSN